MQYPIASLYINGAKVDNANCNITLSNKTRIMNFIGRSSNFPVDKDLNAKIDELKIFNRALSTEEIMFEMMN